MRNLPIVVLGIVLLALTVNIIGCTRYLEEETPTGYVPPAEPTTASAAPGTGPQEGAFSPAGIHQAAPAASRYSPYIGRPLSGAVLPISEELYAASIAAFENAYTAQGTPRIVVYFNRALSDEVREWMTPTREVMTGKGEKVSVGEGGATVVSEHGIVVETASEAKVEGTEDTERGLTSYQQRHIEQLRRENPQEQWMWRFEDFFLQPFLKAGAKTVDRATILRKVSAASGKQGEPYSLMAVKKIEMDALQEYADIYVELLVTRDHTAPTGYAFRALAKRIKDGIILGSVTKAGRDYRYDKSYEAIAGPSGYKLKKSSPALILENVSMELAIDLMNSMANSWQKQAPASATKINK